MSKEEDKATLLKRKQISISGFAYKNISLLAVNNDKRLCEYIDGVLREHIDLKNNLGDK